MQLAYTSDPEARIINIHYVENLISQRVKTLRMIMLQIQILITCNVRIMVSNLLILIGFSNSNDPDGYVWELMLAAQLQQRRKAKNDPQQAQETQKCSEGRKSSPEPPNQGL